MFKNYRCFLLEKPDKKGPEIDNRTSTPTALNISNFITHTHTHAQKNSLNVSQPRKNANVKITKKEYKRKQKRKKNTDSFLITARKKVVPVKNGVEIRTFQDFNTRRFKKESKEMRQWR